jgi:hypothetical protein
MIQLSFQPAYDAYHAIFRLMRLRGVLTSVGPIPLDELRILDFFLLFPYLIEHIRLAPRHRSYKKLARDYAHTRPYSQQPEDLTVFRRLQPLQIAAAQTLASNDLLDLHALGADRAQATGKALSRSMSARVQAANERDAALITFLETLAAEYRFEGPDGLKDRTGLLEYRYDAV